MDTEATVEASAAEIVHYSPNTRPVVEYMPADDVRALVDASVGGKTGINLTLPNGGLGKNLAGAFWQPKLVLADPCTLATLPIRERRCGLAEMIKHAIIGDHIVDQLIVEVMFMRMKFWLSNPSHTHR